MDFLHPAPRRDAVPLLRIFLVSFLQILVLSLTDGVLGAAQSAEITKIAFVKGDVQIKEPATAVWHPATNGEKIEKGAEVITDRDSSCVLRFQSKITSDVRLFPGSWAGVLPADNPGIKLLNGKVFAFCKDPREDFFFQIRTPGAVLSATYAGLYLTASEILVFEGAARVVDSSGQMRDILAGRGVRLDENGRFGQEFAAPADLAADWNQFKLLLKNKEYQKAGDSEQSKTPLSEDNADEIAADLPTEPSTPP